MQLASLHEKLLPRAAKTQLYFWQQRGTVGVGVICGDFALHKQAFIWMGVSQEQLLLFSGWGLLWNKGTQTGWRTTLHKHFLGAPTLLLGSSSSSTIQKQFKMKGNFCQNPKALSDSESCPLSQASFINTLRKEELAPLCKLQIFWGWRKYLVDPKLKQQKEKAKRLASSDYFLLNKQNYETEQRKKTGETFIFQDHGNKTCLEWNSHKKK